MLIAGLGNPGLRYTGTRHNAGFLVADSLAERLHAQPEASPNSGFDLLRVEVDNRSVFLVKPMAFMNRSGVAVREMVDRLGLEARDVLVIYDCLDLPLGRIRLRPAGSSGGHRGVESVIRELETDQFPRLRVGIGRPEFGAAIDYVLSPWAAAELPILERCVEAATDAVVMAITAGLQAAMNRFNGWAAAADDATETPRRDEH